VQEKFFETDRYARLRRVFDYRQKPDHSRLAQAVFEYDIRMIADRQFILGALLPQGLSDYPCRMDVHTSRPAAGVGTSLGFRYLFPEARRRLRSPVDRLMREVYPKGAG
jgi:hypothetical protein